MDITWTFMHRITREDRGKKYREIPICVVDIYPYVGNEVAVIYPYVHNCVHAERDSNFVAYMIFSSTRNNFYNTLITR